MPTLINGCGTWYCGKRRIHRVKAPCSQCGAFVELESYDTTLFFVIFMIPIVPLGQKRILESCPACQRHKLVKLKDWEAGKAKAFNSILEKLQANPDDRETIQMSLGLATVYQDEKLFDKLADALAGHRTDDAEIQAQLGAAYEYFSRWPDAEAAYGRSLNADASDDTRERLAVCLLKQNRPEEAAVQLRHLFDSKDPEKAWLVFWLVEGFMARGMHEQALAVMDVRDQMYPDLAKSKDYLKQRKTAEKNKASGKPIQSAYLAESAKTGFREGSGLGFQWPKYAAAAVFLGLIGLYLGISIYRGENRKVYLVNGWSKAYTVKVNGQSHELPPGVARKIEVSEGEVTVDWPESGDGEQKVTIETSFWSRPFNRPVFVLNPDRTAIVEREEAIYANPPVDHDAPSEVGAGKLLYEFEGVNYEFEPFPHEIKIKGGAHVKKTRVGMVPVGDMQARLRNAAIALPPDQLPAYVKRVVQLDPSDQVALAALIVLLPAEETLAFLRPGLAERPIRVEWHRAYQRVIEFAEPDKDLRPEYRKLVDETKRDAGALFLLGRVEDGPAADKLFEEAAKANSPSPQACSALGGRHLVRGDFDNAVIWTAKAHNSAPSDHFYRMRYVQALLAAGKYADLLKVTSAQNANDSSQFLRERLTALVATNEHGAAEGEITRAATPPGTGPMSATTAQLVAQIRLGLERMLAEVKRDRAKYLEISSRLPVKSTLYDNLLRGNHKAAADAVVDGSTQPPASRISNWEFEATQRGLLYLAGLKAKDAAFADVQWKRFIEALGRGDREGRFFAAVASGKQAFDVIQIKTASTSPSLKRVALMALARKFPQHAKELEPLAKKLDFERDEVSLALRYVTE